MAKLRRFYIYISLAVVFVLCMEAFWLIRVSINPQHDSLEYEFAKALLQVGVVAVIGALISLLSFEYQRQRQQSDKDRELERMQLEYREELLKATLAKAMDSYSNVKKARRLLRARAIRKSVEPSPDPELVPDPGSGPNLEPKPEPKHVLAKYYDKYMEMVNDAQLSFEHLARDVQTNQQAFRQHQQLEADLRSIEKYLERLIAEYEKKRRTFPEGPESTKALDSLPRLRDFLGPSKPSNFRDRVLRPYSNVQGQIRSDLIHPLLPKSEGAWD